MRELSETAVLARLQTKWVGQFCRYEPVVGSTNALLKRAVVNETAVALPAGTLYLTDYQTEGRGRLQRKWEAPPGTSLLFSLLFRPDWPAAQANWLTMMAGLAAVEAVEAAATVKAGLKWPNDLILCHNGQWRKLGGILLEGDVDGTDGRLRSVVVGMGLNVNIPPDQLPAAAAPPTGLLAATSLLAATGQTTNRLRLLVDLLQRLERYYEAAAAGHSPQPAWNERLLTLGQPVRVSQPASAGAAPLDGTAESTDEWGALLVRDGSGQLHTVNAGDVTLRP